MKSVEQQAGGVEPQEASQHSYEVYILKTKKEREGESDKWRKKGQKNYCKDKKREEKNV